jgi:hypothetical protein
MAPNMSSNALPEPVDVARTRRAELLAAISGLERALAVPARDPTWATQVEHGISTLEAAFDHHVAATEGTDGVYGEILATAPRFRFAIDRLIVEHGQARAGIQTLAKRVGELEPPDRDAIDQIRRDGTALLGRLVRHRQRGADLVFEAYEQDIGGSN